MYTDDQLIANGYTDGTLCRVVTVTGGQIKIGRLAPIRLSPGGSGMIWASDEIYHDGSRWPRARVWTGGEQIKCGGKPLHYTPSIFALCRVDDLPACIAYLHKTCLAAMMQDIDDLLAIIDLRIAQGKELQTCTPDY